VPRADPDGPTRRVIGANATKTVAVTQDDPDDQDEPTHTVIGIGAIRSVLRQVNLKPYEGTCTVIIFDRAELMSGAAANALLKTLEEPPPQVMLLLLTADEEALLPTIRSRCRRLLLRPVPKGLMVERLVASHGVDPDRAEWLARFARGCPGWAVAALAEGEGLLESRGAHLERLMEMCDSGLEARFSFASDLAFLFSRDREAVRQVFYLWLRWWRDLLLIKEGAEEYIHNEDRITELRLQASHLATAQVVAFIKRLEETLEALDHNVSARLALEVMMLDLPTKAARA
jgi:DNA polymerase-3 subunit delta'